MGNAAGLLASRGTRLRVPFASGHHGTHMRDRSGTLLCNETQRALLRLLSQRTSCARRVLLSCLTESDMARLYFVCRAARRAVGWHWPSPVVVGSEAWVSCAQAAEARLALGLERADDRVMSSATLAARYGALDALTATLRSAPAAAEVPVDACSEAARGGHTRCLAYLRHTCRARRRPVEVACLAALSGQASCLALALDDARALLQSTRDRYGELFGCMVCANAAASGSVDCLRVARGRGCAWDSTTCAMAARNGSVALLRYARERGCPWDGTTTSFAAAAGSMECLRYAVDGGCLLDVDACAAASRGAQPRVLMWLMDRLAEFRLSPARDKEADTESVSGVDGGLGRSVPDSRLLARLVEVAAQGDSCECLHVLRAAGAEGSALACRMAASVGSLRCLRYLRETMQAPWDSSVCAAAARAGSVACLEYARTSGCRWGPRTCAAAAEAGSVACLAYAREHGCAWDAEVTAAAARADSLECLRYASENGCAWHPQVYCEAARRGSLRCLAFAAARGCPFPSEREDLEQICPAAASSGDPAVLRAVRSHARAVGLALPWGPTTCEAAALARSLPCLRYAHESGCAWDGRTTEAAAAEGAELCLRYAHERGCAWDAPVWYKAASRRHYGALAYALRHGCNNGSIWKKWRGDQQPLEEFVELNIIYTPQ